MESRKFYKLITPYDRKMANITATEEISSGINYLDLIFKPIFSKLLISLIILLVGFIVGKILGRIVHKILKEVELNRIIKSATGIRFSAEELIGTFITYCIYFISVIMALNFIGVTTTVLNMISAAVIVIIIISIFLGIKDFIPNAIAGIVINQKNKIKEGSYVKVRDVKGKIISINLTETKIETKEKDTIYIPNSILTRNEVIILKRES